MDLFFDYYFSFLSVNTEINNRNKKHRLKLTNLEELHSLERQKYDKQLARWLNYFENDGIWTIFQEFLKLHSHISVFWGFLMNFRDFRVFVFGYRAQNEYPEITEKFYFCVYKVQIHLDLFFDHYFSFLSVNTEINKQTKTKKTGLS